MPDGALTREQTDDDARSTCFDTVPLGQDQTIVGAPTVELTLTSNTPVAQVAVRLCEVDSTGLSQLITCGVLNLTHRESAENPAAIPVGKPARVSLTLDQIAYTLATGSRLRLSISNAYWPLHWPAPGRTTLTLTGGQIILPKLNETPGDTVTFDAPKATPAWQIRTLRPPAHSHKTTTNTKSGVTNPTCIDDEGEVQDLDHGLISGTISREYWKIHPDDPLSARGDTHWSYVNRRADWSVRTETWSGMRSDAQNFHLTARIEAHEGDKLIFERDFTKTIRRNLV